MQLFSGGYWGYTLVTWRKPKKKKAGDPATEEKGTEDRKEGYRICRENKATVFSLQNKEALRGKQVELIDDLMCYLKKKYQKAFNIFLGVYERM